MPSVRTSYALSKCTTAEAILDTIADVLNRDGATVESRDVTSGMDIVTCDGFRFHLSLDEPEILDDADWRRRRGLDTEWMGDTTPDLEF